MGKRGRFWNRNSQRARIEKLNKIAIQQMKILEDIEDKTPLIEKNNRYIKNE